MNLKAERQQLADIISGTYKVYAHIPERVSPPAIAISTGSPYVVPGTLYGDSVKVKWEATILAGKATNEVSTDQLDNMIFDVVMNLMLNGYAFEVSEHKVYQSNNADYLAVDVGITKEIRLGE